MHSDCDPKGTLNTGQTLRARAHPIISLASERVADVGWEKDATQMGRGNPAP